MTTVSALRELAARVMDLELPVEDEEVTEAYRDKATDWHPDVSDDEDAQEKFLTLQLAQEILKDEVDWANKSKRDTIIERFGEFFPEEDLGQITRDGAGGRGFASSPGARQDPEDFDVSDFMGASGQERRQMQQELMLGVEAMLVYQSTEGLYRQDFSRDDFYNTVNAYMMNVDAETVDFDDYYLAVEEGLRADITRDIFIDSIQTVQDNLQDEYGDGADVREIAMVISYFMSQGNVAMGFDERFIRDNRFARDDRFSRGSRFGRDGRFSRDRRFDR